MLNSNPRLFFGSLQLSSSVRKYLSNGVLFASAFLYVKQKGVRHRMDASARPVEDFMNFVNASPTRELTENTLLPIDKTTNREPSFPRRAICEATPREGRLQSCRSRASHSLT